MPARSELPPTTSSPRVSVDVGVGELIVLLPPGAQAVIDDRASVGEVELIYGEEDGIHVERTNSGPPLRVTDRGRLTLDLEVGIGRVEARSPFAGSLRPARGAGLSAGAR